MNSPPFEHCWFHVSLTDSVPAPGYQWSQTAVGFNRACAHRLTEIGVWSAIMIVSSFLDHLPFDLSFNSFLILTLKPFSLATFLLAVPFAQSSIKFIFEVESDTAMVDIIVNVSRTEIKAGVSGVSPLRISVRFKREGGGRGLHLRCRLCLKLDSWQIHALCVSTT